MSARNTAREVNQKLPAIIYVLAACTFLMLTSEFVVAGILPEMAAGLTISLSAAGTLVTVFALGMIIGAPTITGLSLRFARKRTLQCALVLFALSHVVVSCSSSFLVVAVARFTAALATGAFWAVAFVAAVAAMPPALATRAISVVTAGGTLATVFGVPAGTFLAQKVGWQGTFWVLAGGAIIALITVSVLLHYRRQDATSRFEKQAGERERKTRLGFSKQIAYKPFFLALAICALNSTGMMAVYSYISPLLTTNGWVPQKLLPVLLICFGVASFVGTLLVGRFAGQFPHSMMIATALCSILSLLVLFLGQGSFALAIVGTVLFGLSCISANSVYIHFAVKSAGEAGEIGSALSVSAFNVGNAAGSVLAAFALATPLGEVLGVRIVLLFGIAGFALTLLPIWGLARVHRQIK